VSLGYLWADKGWHYKRSLASRVTLLTTMAVGLAVAFVSLGGYLTVRVQMQAALDQSLLERSHAVSNNLEAFLRSGPSESDFPTWLLGASDLQFFLVTSEGAVFTTPGGERLDLDRREFRVAGRHDDESLRTIVQDGRRYRAAAVPTDRHGYAVVLVQSLESQDNVLARLGLVTLLLGGAGVIAAGLAGWVVARNGLRPVRKLTVDVERIARTEDLRPIEVEGNDEIARLATAFNHMLAALSASRDRQRQLVADAGHELRTPLTSLRTNLELLVQSDAAGGLAPEQRAELLDDVSAQMAELTTLIGDLMELAREEPVDHVVAPVDLAEVVERAVARVRRRAPALEFVVDTDPWWVTGEADALERAVLNLLDNAAKWSPPGGAVSVTLNGGLLVVDDEGPGISEEDLPHVFDRFYRSPESRTMPGSGLGLSIVRQVAERHAGRVEASRNPRGGARLSLRLPGRVAPD
jgi:two-component system sensor histidine kinase MprB